MVREARGFIERVRAGASDAKDLSGVADWIVRNTRDPKFTSRQWSFKDHEYQIEIANSEAAEVDVRKCSQVGMSELSVRVQLALLSIFPGYRAIYTLPTTGFARQFTKDRFDSVVEASPELSALMDSNVDGSEMKRLGTSYLYIKGTFGKSAAISIPADILFNDEVDFSNQEVLTSFSSRLGHAEGGGITRRFSTPTVEGFGISEGFAESSQARYLIKHDRCGKWVAPSWFDDLVIPGYDKPMMEFESLDYRSKLYGVESAYILCPNCRNPVKHDNYCDASKRRWVHAHPDRDKKGYQVMPFDVPKHNPIPKTLSTITKYKRKADWVNFKIGLPFQDAENAFLGERIEQQRVLTAVLPVPRAAFGCVMGVDIGKTSWVTIGKPMNGRTHIIHQEQIRQGANHELTTRLQLLLEYFGVVKCIVDAAPDFTTALTLIGDPRNWIGRVYGCYYVHSNKKKLTNVEVNDAEGVVTAYRTGTFDDLVKRVNGGVYQYSKTEESLLMKEHLSNMKRVTYTNNQGEEVASWVSTGDDHYGHSLNYMHIAEGLLEHVPKGASMPSLPMVSKTKVKSDTREEDRTYPTLLGERRR
jgi:hypothetical protein